MEYLILAVGLFLILVGAVITWLQIKIIKELKVQKKNMNRFKI
jgi:hypothetical protein